METLPGVKEAVGFFAFTLAELAVLFVGISFLVGVINEFLPKELVKKWLSGRKGRGYFIGSFLGGLTPFCSCSTIPFTVGLLRADAGFGPTMTFLFTSPLVNPIIIPLFLALLGVKVTLIYGVVALGMAIMIGFMLEKAGFDRFIKREQIWSEGGTMVQGSASDSSSKSTSQSCCGSGKVQPVPVVHLQQTAQSNATPSLASGLQTIIPMASISAEAVQNGRWKRIFNEAVKQFRSLLPFILLGVAIGSVIHGFFPKEIVADIAGKDSPLAVPISAVVGIPLYLRVSTMVPIATSLIAKGMSTGAVVALIIGGAGASLPEMAMLRGLFKTPLLLAFIASVLSIAITAGLLINVFAA